MIYNLNQKVRITPNERTEKAWQDYHNALGLEAPPFNPVMQIWEWAHTFGPLFCNGLAVPHGMDIEILSPEEQAGQEVSNVR